MELTASQETGEGRNALRVAGAGRQESVEVFARLRAEILIEVHSDRSASRDRRSTVCLKPRFVASVRNRLENYDLKNSTGGSRTKY
jgi:hypothetical protein